MSAESHYQVLGVDRTADARAIKKAYFALIRKFSPESDPDAFQRIRAAYEVLSDAEQKDRYDHAEKGFSELDSAVGERLRAISEAAKEETAEAIIEMLKGLAADHPDVSIVREQLAFALLRKDMNEPALEEFKWLCSKEPENARWPFHRGVALGRLGRFADALSQIEKSLTLDPTPIPPRLALSEVLAELDRTKDAIARLEDGITNVEADSPGFYALTLRKAELLYRVGSVEKAEKTLLKCTASVTDDAEADKRKFVAGQIASLAAKLFAKNEMESANRALAIAADVVPESAVERPYPFSSRALASSLPERTREWLANLPTGTSTPTVPEAVWTWPFLTSLGGMLVIFGAAMGAGDGTEPWIMAGLAAVGAALFAWGLTMIATLMSGPLRGFITVHPLWVIRARGDRLQIFSLFSLASTNGTHHHTNGVYTHTSIILAFGGEKRETVTVNIRNQGYAQAWLSYLWEARGRSLELLSEGFLEAEGGVDLLPPAEVDRVGALSSSTKKGPSLPLLVPLVAVVAVAVGWYANARLGDRALVAALSDGHLSTLIAYEKQPSSARGPSVTGVVDRAYARARARVDGTPLAPLVEQMQKQRRVGVKSGSGSRVHLSSALASALGAGTAAMGAGEVLAPVLDARGLVIDVVDATTDGGTRWIVEAKVGDGPKNTLGEFTTARAGAELSASLQEEIVTKTAQVLGVPFTPKGPQ